MGSVYLSSPRWVSLSIVWKIMSQSFEIKATKDWLKTAWETFFNTDESNTILRFTYDTVHFLNYKNKPTSSVVVGQEKSLKHKLGSISGFCLLTMFCWLCGNILVPCTRRCRFEYFFNKIQWKYLRKTQMPLHSCAAFVLSRSHIALTLQGGRESQTFFCNILNNLLAMLESS